MKTIHSTSDFEAVLRAERAIVLIDFAWSAEAAESRQAIERWEKELESQPEKRDWAIYRLAPDGFPDTWKWVGTQVVGLDSTQSGAGTVLWLKAGMVVGRAPNADGLGSKGLARLTREYFHWPGSEPGEDELSVCDPELLKILCCPETHQELKPATGAVVQKLNQSFVVGTLQSRNGQLVREKMEGGLVRADGKFLYPIRHNIPILLVDDAIPLAGI
ncbi:MAG: hypothetical protein JWR69_2839 [Pedosphaera sp.]|nr:hypothetical protein [Pedosphaera sp.]